MNFPSHIMEWRLVVAEINRRQVLRAGFYGIPAAGLLYGFLVETKWLAVREVFIGNRPTHRIVHFSDVHYKGDRSYLNKIIHRIIGLSPDFAVFTGDLIEDIQYLKEALDILKKIECPLYGVPGNHEYWCKAPFSLIADCFNSTGGGWIVDGELTTPDGQISVAGAVGHSTQFLEEPRARKRLLLVHYPDYVQNLGGRSFDLILAGHSHGGQVRIPMWGAPALPYGVGKYDKGLFFTPSGPLYVNPGVGWYLIPLRLFCRPEITVIHF